MLENPLKIGNTHFRKKAVHKLTRQILSRDEKSIIDYFLIDNKI